MTAPVVALTESQLEALAESLAERCAPRLADLLERRGHRDGHGALVTAAVVADALGVKPEWVYRHSAELGVQRLGKGPRAPLRFDLDRAVVAATACSPSKESEAQKTAAPSGKRRRRPAASKGSSVDLLPIRGPSLPDFSDGRSA